MVPCRPPWYLAGYRPGRSLFWRLWSAPREPLSRAAARFPISCSESCRHDTAVQSGLPVQPALPTSSSRGAGPSLPLRVRPFLVRKSTYDGSVDGAILRSDRFPPSPCRCSRSMTTSYYQLNNRSESIRNREKPARMRPRRRMLKKQKSDKGVPRKNDRIDSGKAKHRIRRKPSGGRY
jgi:hypothetical protein